MDQLDEIGYRAWTVFYDQMQERFGLGRGRAQFWQNKHYRTFRRLAELVLARQIEVTDYVIHAFDLLQKNHRYITPKDLVDSRLADAYLEYRKAYGGDAGDLQFQIQTLANLECQLIPDKYEDEDALLLDPNLSFEAWFRVLHPQRFNETIFKLYGSTAWQQLVITPVLKQLAQKYYKTNYQELERRMATIQR